jgi:rubrerythrin
MATDVKFLRHMIKDEKMAPPDYRRLKKKLPKKYAPTINGIIRDEKAHKKKLIKILRKVR